MAKKLPKVKKDEEVMPKSQPKSYCLIVFKIEGANEYRTVLYPTAKHFETDWEKAQKVVSEKMVYLINRLTGEIEPQENI